MSILGCLEVPYKFQWVGGVGGVVWCGPTHYFVNPNLELRLSWAVTITDFLHYIRFNKMLNKIVYLVFFLDGIYTGDILLKHCL